MHFVETENFNSKNIIAFGNNQQESGAFAIAPGHCLILVMYSLELIGLAVLRSQVGMIFNTLMSSSITDTLLV